MRRLCWLVVAGAMVFGSCGSSTDNGPDNSGSDALVLAFQGFNDTGISQCDTVNPGGIEVDVVQDLCSNSTCSDTGTMAEPFTETSVNAVFQNNQKLDITLNSYDIVIPGTGVPMPITYLTSQVITGRRCSNALTLPCGSSNDCTLSDGTIGTCQAATTTAEGLLLFSLTTKQQILPDVAPFGKTINVTVTFHGTDVSGGDWTAQGSIAASFNNFCNCGCSLSMTGH